MKEMIKKIWFDMDGTIADLYGVEGWLESIRAGQVTPYIVATPMVNLSLLARLLNQLQREGWELGIISWGARNATPTFQYDTEVAKIQWLNMHMPSVHWDSIKVVRHGLNKYEQCKGGILFDDEQQNRDSWEDLAYEPNYIIDVLKQILHNNRTAHEMVIE